MVQRNKAGDDRRPKARKRLDLSSQIPEGRNRDRANNESKKIMKKSASIKLSEVGNKVFQSPNLEGRNKERQLMKTVNKSKTVELSDVNYLISLPQTVNLVQPGKPPPSMVTEVSVLNKARASKAPNYMKSTSCSDGRKDRKQVTNLQARRNLEYSKPDQSGKCLAKSSSLKLGRVLKKSPSFKDKGSSMKNVPRAALCSDIHVMKATCSSLLKDSKFPSYVMVNPGATESEGTSIMKVCTYKYCSLNGLHHAMVPPLRSFVSERRRSLKNQKSKLTDVTEQGNGTKGKCLAGLDYTVREGVDFGVQKSSNDPEHDLAAEGNTADCVEVEGKTENASELGSDGSMEAEDESSVDKENSRSPLKAISSIEETIEAESDEELYESIWEAYEKELQEFEFIDTLLDDKVYVEIGNGGEFDCRLETLIAKSSFEDELEGGCQEDGESFEGKVLEKHTEVGLTATDVEIYQDNKTTDDKEKDHLRPPNNKSYEPVMVQQTVEEVEVIISYTEDPVDSITAAAEDNHSCARSRYEQEDQALIELNGEDDDQKENKKELLEHREREMDHERVVEPEGQYIDVLMEKDAESEISTLDGGVERGKEDEENVTDTSKNIHEPVSPGHADSMAEGIHHSDKDEGNIPRGKNAEGCIELSNSTISKAANDAFKAELNMACELSGSCNLKIIKCEADEQDLGSTKCFNPQEPNYLPLEPESKGEQVDLRHQDIDERKNSEEWMVDYALQKTVNKLAPVKRKKVELLVEAFETVAPTSKRDHHTRRASFAFANIRTIQVCN